jgi:hypothetical protein
MKTNVPLRHTVLLLVIALSACSVAGLSGSGNVVSITSDSSGFDQVVISDAFRVSIRQGEDFSVVIRVDDNLVDDVEVSQVGRRLTLGLRPDLSRGVRRATLEADITMPVLAALEASGASRVALSGFVSQEDLEMVASGASVVTGDIQAGSATMTASGASDISLVGSGEDLVLEVTGASSADLAEFPVSDVRAVLEAASTAVVNASGTLDVEASGASHLTYVGDPTVGSVQTSAGSTVEAR